MKTKINYDPASNNNIKLQVLFICIESAPLNSVCLCVMCPPLYGLTIFFFFLRLYGLTIVAYGFCHCFKADTKLFTHCISLIWCSDSCWEHQMNIYANSYQHHKKDVTPKKVAGWDQQLHWMLNRSSTRPI